MSSKKKFEETTLPPVPAKKVKITVTNSLSLTTRKKTGGRVRLTLEQKLELAAQRSKIASFHDDTTLEPELAALYLGISEKKLEELRLIDALRLGDIEQARTDGCRDIWCGRPHPTLSR